METGLLYARVSSDEQAEFNTSITSQVELGLDRAVINDVIIPPEFVFREDFSGKTLDRPELSKVRKILQAGKATTLIVLNADRLDRSEWGVNLLILLQELKQLKVTLLYSENNRRVDLENPQEMLLESIKGWQSGEDRTKTVSKLAKGRIDRARQGGVLVAGKPPYGYEVYREHEHKGKAVLVVNEDEARIVRLIFLWYVDEGLSIYAIAQKLTEMGVPTPSESGNRARGRDKKAGYTEWGRSTIHKILGNETYCGVWRYSKTNTPIEVEVPAVVTREVWLQAQARGDQNKREASRNRKHEYLFAGRVRCGVCGRAMMGKSKQVGKWHYLYYQCTEYGNKFGYNDCDLPRFRADQVDNIALQFIKEVLTSPKKLREAVERQQQEWEETQAPRQRELEAVTSQLSIHREEHERTLEAWLQTKALGATLAADSLLKRVATTEQIIRGLEIKQQELLTDITPRPVGLTFAVTDDTYGEMTITLGLNDYIVTRYALEERLKTFEGRRGEIIKYDIKIKLIAENGQRFVKVGGGLGTKTLPVVSIILSIYRHNRPILFSSASLPLLGK